MMVSSLILQMFLYFPEDKTEYIPAAISFFIFFIGAIVTMYLIVRVSKKQEEKTKHLEEELKRKRSIK